MYKLDGGSVPYLSLCLANIILRWTREPGFDTSVCIGQGHKGFSIYFVDG
nr:MAG TPA: hypothetical protein [Caudoviricetes sp.]